MTLGLGAHVLAGGAIPLSVAADPRVITEPDYTLAVSADPSHGAISIELTRDSVTYGPFNLMSAQYQALSYNLIAPVLSGTGEVGQTLDCAAGIWLVDPETALTASYQWLRDGVAITGATAQNYTVIAADAGTTLVCRETLGTAFAETEPRQIADLAAVSLIDLTLAPNSSVRFTIAPLPNGVALTQNSTGTPRINWNTLEPLVTGTSYRLRGTVNISSPLEQTAQLFVSDPAGLGTDRIAEETMEEGTNSIDTTLTVTSATKIYSMTIIIDQASGIGATASLTDFTLEAV